MTSDEAVRQTFRHDLEHPQSVSAIVTCYNEAAFIQQAIRSVLDQTWPVLEVAVVDDGSTDDSPFLLRAISDRQRRLRLLRITNRGLAGARNAGLLALKPTQWVLFLDGDDWLEPDFVQETVRRGADADAVVTSIVKHRNGKTTGPTPALVQNAQGIWRRNTLHSCALFRRSALVEVGGFHPAVAGHCDWDLWLDLLLHGRKVVSCETTAYHYRIRPGTYSTSEAAQDREANIAEMRRHFAGRLA